MSPECVCEGSSQNNPHIIYYIILNMPILSGSNKQAVLVHVSLKCKWAAVPHPFFQNRAAPLQLVPKISAKNICLVLITMSIALKSSNWKPYQFKLDIRFVRMCAQKQAKWHVSTKPSSLSCLIALKLSNTHKLQKHSCYVYEVKQLGNKLHVYIRSAY